MASKSIKDFLVGTLVGIVSMMPGASGGIIAVIFGVYERIIADLADIRGKGQQVTLSLAGNDTSIDFVEQK